MNYDLQTTLIVIGVAIGLTILLWLLLRQGVGRRQSIKSEPVETIEAAPDDPYAASKERPYVRETPPAPPPPESLRAADPMPEDRPSHERWSVTPAAPQEPQSFQTPHGFDSPRTSEPSQTSEPGTPPQSEEEEPEVAQPAVPLPGDFAGIAFPPHSTDHPDELTRLKGIGPKLAALLNQEGVTRYEQLASLDEAELAALENRLGAFRGRLTRDRVVEQARLLASGDTAEFEARFGKLGGA